MIDEKGCGGKLVYELDEYIIMEVHSGNRVGYIAYNTNKPWEGSHSHLKSFNMAKTIISNVKNHKKPKTKNLYLMKSHIRLSADEDYIKYIEDLMYVTKSKGKQDYRNRSKF